MDGRKNPLCKKCGNNHLNFFSCSDAEKTRDRASHPPVVWRTNPAGTVGEWGDRLGENTIRIGDGATLLNRRRPLRLGSVTPDPDWDDGPQAA